MPYTSPIALRERAALQRLSIVLAAVPVGCGTEAEPRPNVVLIVVDTLRADRLPFLGCPKDTAPFLEELAAESIVFESAWSPSSWTLPAAVSTFTSVHPFQHGVTQDQGRDLLSDPAPRPILSALTAEPVANGLEGNLRSILLGRHRLIVAPDGRAELHDVAADPMERRDIASEQPEVVAKLRRRTRARRARGTGVPRSDPHPRARERGHARAPARHRLRGRRLTRPTRPFPSGDRAVRYHSPSFSSALHRSAGRAAIRAASSTSSGNRRERSNARSKAERSRSRAPSARRRATGTAKSGRTTSSL